MLTAITTENEVRKTQKKFEGNLLESLPKRTGKFTIGYQGGSFEKNGLHADQNIWFVSHTEKNAPIPRYWNAFGLADKLLINGSNNIAVEINVPLSGSNGTVSGFFAKNQNGEVFLLHSGKIGGGRKGIGKNSFLSWYCHPTVKVLRNKKSQDALIVTNINSSNIAVEIGEFVKAVSAFKNKSQEDEISILSNSSLIKKIPIPKSPPQRNTIETMAFVRNRYIVEYVKRRANGKCDLCEKLAPFKDSLNKPFLECHHVIWLSMGGTDTVGNSVALCPNCHRKMHIIKAEGDINKLKAKAKITLK